MSEYSLRLAKPHCEACHKPKNLVDVKLDEIIVYKDDISYKHPIQEPPTLAERLQQTIQQAKIQDEDEI